MTATPPATVIGLDDRREWGAALGDIPHAFWHTWDNCHAVSAHTGLRTFLFSLEAPDMRAVCPLVERPIGQHADLVTPYAFSGFVGTGDLSSLAVHWRRFAEDAGYVCAYLVLNPALSDGSSFGPDLTRGRSLFVIDLTLDEDALFARLSTNRRRELRKAARSEWLVTDQDLLSSFFVETYPEFMASRSAAAVYTLPVESLNELCDSEHTLLLGAERDGRVRAASLFAYTRHAGDFLFNVSLPGEESYSAPLIWAGLRELKARNVPSLNLGGGVREGDGVEQFKERFGSERRPLQVIKQIFRPDLYRTLCEEAGVDAGRTDYFPAYRAPR